jgi:hypothetical protein
MSVEQIVQICAEDRLLKVRLKAFLANIGEGLKKERLLKAYN